MSDNFGISEGIKGLSGALNETREATKGLSKSIEGIQQDGTDVARQKARERLTAKREAEVRKQLAIHKALEQYKQKRLISEEEFKLKTEFIKKYGSKDWEEVLRIKDQLEKLEKIEEQQFKADLAKVRRVQFYCFIVAAWIAWYFTWGYK